MITMNSAHRRLAALAALAAVTACSNASQISDILSGVLGGSSGNAVSGTIQSVDTRNLQLTLTATNGQNVALSYDNNTQVIYQNSRYAVTNLERGDEVTARVQQLQNGGYYTDSITVVRSASGSTTTGGTTGGNSVQSFTGSVTSIDRTNGWFTMNASGGGQITVTLPYNTSTTDVSRFQALRTGDSVRFYGVYVTNTRVELRNFY